MLIQIQYLLNHFQLVECFSVMSQWWVEQLGGLVAPNSRQIPPLVWALPVKLLICLSKYNLKVANSASLYLSLFIAQARPRLPRASPSHQFTPVGIFKKDLKSPPQPVTLLTLISSNLKFSWKTVAALGSGCRQHTSWQDEWSHDRRPRVFSMISKASKIHDGAFRNFQAVHVQDSH